MKRCAPLAVMMLSAVLASAQTYTLKFATVAPDGSAWVKTLRDLDKALREQSAGRLGLKLYPGGVAGDEKDVIRKIRLGQYNGGGFTGVGINDAAKLLRILDSPFLFRSYAEADFITLRYENQFEAALADGGFVLLGWAEVGFLYMFSNAPVASLDDLKGLKPWLWEGDPIATALYKAAGVSPVPLPATDVMSSLQTGLIDAVYASPYALIALQWFTRVRFALDQPISDALGAALVSKKFYDSLPADLQEILMTNCRTYLGRLTPAGRVDNARAIDTLKQRGMKFIKPTPEVSASITGIGDRARQMLVGQLFSGQFLDDVMSSLQAFRAARGGA